MYIDTHVHFYDKAFPTESEVDAAIDRALAAGVSVMLQPDTDSKERDRMFAIEDRHPGELYSMLGLYPGSVDESWEQEISKMLGYRDRHIVAIGEIGLDYHYGAGTAGLQKAALKAQFEMAAEMDLPVNIHLRDATEDFFKVLHDCRHLGLRGTLHAFGGSYETYERVSRYGDWTVGIGGVVTFKKARVAESVRKIPLEAIVLETDSPYLTPTPYRGKRNESSYIPLIAAKVAELKGISIEEVEEVTTESAKRLYSI